MSEFGHGREKARKRVNKSVLNFFNKPENIELIAQAAINNDNDSFNAVYDRFDEHVKRSNIWNSAVSDRENYVLDLVYNMLQDFIRHYAHLIKVLYSQLDENLSSSASSDHPDFFDFSSQCTVITTIKSLWLSTSTQDSLFRIFKLNYAKITKQKKPKEYSIKESVQCVICYEMIHDCNKDFEVLKCNHVFHNCCIGSWKRRSDSCPCCRQKM
jgi:hypothetical protein